MKIEIDPHSWDQGVRDGATSTIPPTWSRGLSKGPGRDSFSYSSGRIEGEAYRDGYEVSMQVANVAVDAVKSN